MIVLNPHEIDTILYHANCTDGFGAAWAAWKLLGGRAVYIPASYGGEIPDVTGKNVAIVDFSYPREVLEEMREKANSLVLLDHHVTAEEALKGLPYAIFDMSKSGAMLSWEFFHKDKEPPRMIKYIQDRDLWSWELPYSKEFSAAFSMVPFEFAEFDKYEDDSMVDDAIKRGGYILAYTRQIVEKEMGHADRRKLLGYDVLVVNCSHLISEVGAELAKNCDIAVIWYYSHKDASYKISLRSFHDHVDCSQVAKHFGGGGHKKASGFLIDKHCNIESIFDKEDEIEE
jgi:uncharacterized protein